MFSKVMVNVKVARLVTKKQLMVGTNNIFKLCASGVFRLVDVRSVGHIFYCNDVR